MSDRTIGGIKISGDFNAGHNFVQQRPETDLVPILSNLLRDPNVVAFGWHQYTPYFNDGDECVFGASSVWVKTVWDTEPDEEDEDEYGYYTEDKYDVDYGHGVIGQHDYKEVDGKYQRVYANNDPLVVVVRNNADALSTAVEGGSFDHVLLEKFGNHARITATKEGFEVETYDHD